mgnify:CR=1 FL=1
MVLYVTDRAVAESVRAFQLLEETHLPFLVSPAADDQVGVDWGGRAFRSLAGVERLATALNRFRAALAAGPWPDGGDPEIKRLAVQRLEGYVKVARERMDAILAQRVPG